ncbi:MAG: imidazoleglycerol-phosphate dehydratase HisB [Pseudomonadota bacterium]
MTGELDLSQPPARLAETLTQRLRTALCDALNASEERLALFTDEGDARRRLDAAGITGWRDQTAEGVVALDAPLTGPALYRIGPDEAPVCVGVLDEAVEPGAALCPLVLKAALDAITPGALMKTRADAAEREAALQPFLAWLLGEADKVEVRLGHDRIALVLDDPAALHARLQAFGVSAERVQSGLVLWLSSADQARALVRRLGLSSLVRRASVRRTTKETDVAVALDLDGQGARVDTGVRFFDHMLEQIARHAGVSLEVSCVGDVDVDAHHTIEDVCLAFGEALREALADKRGIGRFGFALPMDETRASVWIDLSGRPYFRFDGEIPGERVSDFPVEMAPHAFRSIAESLRASIHVEVDGENAHHMIESCFKAFGRAVRQAIAIEDDALPSTKGVL